MSCFESWLSVNQFLQIWLPQDKSWYGTSIESCFKGVKWNVYYWYLQYFVISQYPHIFLNRREDSADIQSKKKKTAISPSWSGKTFGTNIVLNRGRQKWNFHFWRPGQQTKIQLIHIQNKIIILMVRPPMNVLERCSSRSWRVDLTGPPVWVVGTWQFYQVSTAGFEDVLQDVFVWIERLRLDLVLTQLLVRGAKNGKSIFGALQFQIYICSNTTRNMQICKR